jgi:hypothetical protein
MPIFKLSEKKDTSEKVVSGIRLTKSNYENLNTRKISLKDLRKEDAEPMVQGAPLAENEKKTASTVPVSLPNTPNSIAPEQSTIELPKKVTPPGKLKSPSPVTPMLKKESDDSSKLKLPPSNIAPPLSPEKTENKQTVDNIKQVETTIDKQLKFIREDNNIQLDNMRKTVDEILQTTLEKRLSESFKQVSERLEQVHKGLGEMQNIATGVGDLKKVLSNVKTRGVLGEYQLENILEQILTPEQYAKNVATKKGSQANVEFALKLPGKESGKDVWMPIDSKFPIEDYHMLLDAFEKGDKQEIELAEKVLIKK